MKKKNKKKIKMLLAIARNDQRDFQHIIRITQNTDHLYEYGLKEAINVCNPFIFQKLIDKGADPAFVFNDRILNQFDISSTLLIYACRINLCVKIIKILLSDERVDPNWKDSEGLTALVYVIIDDDGDGNVVNDIVSLFLKTPSFNINEKIVKGGIEATYLILAAHKGKQDIIALLLQHEDIETETKIHGRTALMISILKGFPNIAKILIQHGVNIKFQDDTSGQTALHMSAMRGYSDVVNLLLKKGADPDIQDKDGQTALLVASMNNHADIVTDLIQHHANLDIQDKDGRTALIVATCKRFRDIALQLITAGANLEKKDFNNKSAIDYARGYERSRSSRHLRKRMETIQEMILGAMKIDDIATIGRLPHRVSIKKQPSSIFSKIFKMQDRQKKNKSTAEVVKYLLKHPDLLNEVGQLAGRRQSRPSQRMASGFKSPILSKKYDVAQGDQHKATQEKQGGSKSV